MKIFFKLTLLLGLLYTTLFAVDVPAAQVSRYDVTFKKLEIYNSSTDTWITISDTTKTVDIASANAGDEVAGLASNNLAITYGTYTKVRATIGNTFTIAACGNVGDDCTDGTTFISGTHTIATAADANNTATAATNTIDFSQVGLLPSNGTLVGSDVRLEYDFSSSFTIDQTTISAPSISVDFNVDNVVEFVDATNSIYVEQPTVTITVN